MLPAGACAWAKTARASRCRRACLTRGRAWRRFAAGARCAPCTTPSCRCGCRSQAPRGALALECCSVQASEAGAVDAKSMWSVHCLLSPMLLGCTASVPVGARIAFPGLVLALAAGAHDQSPQARARAARRARCHPSSWRSGWQPRGNRPSPRPSARRASDLNACTGRFLCCCDHWMRRCRMHA